MKAGNALPGRCYSLVGLRWCDGQACVVVEAAVQSASGDRLYDRLVKIKQNSTIVDSSILLNFDVEKINKKIKFF